MTQKSLKPVNYLDYIQDPIRISHAVQNISIPPTRNELNQLPQNKKNRLVKNEIRKRKRIIAGLHKEIQELDELL